MFTGPKAIAVKVYNERCNETGKAKALFGLRYDDSDALRHERGRCLDI